MKRKIHDMKKFWSLYLFIGIFGILSLMFGIYPLIKSIMLSFHDSATVFTNPRFIGMENYLEIFGDSYFWDSFQVTIFLQRFPLCSIWLPLFVWHSCFPTRELRGGLCFLSLPCLSPLLPRMWLAHWCGSSFLIRTVH